MTGDGYRWVEHTSELELEIHAHAEEAVFAEALRAFAELVGDGRGGEPVSRQVALAGQDRAVLLTVVERVVSVVEAAGLAGRVAQLVPLAVLKG